MKLDALKLRKKGISKLEHIIHSFPIIISIPFITQSRSLHNNVTNDL